MDDLDEEYEELREEHYEGLKDRKFLSYKAARERKLEINWRNQKPPVKPTFLGTKVTRLKSLELVVTCALGF